MIIITVDLSNFSDPPSDAILAQQVEDYVPVRIQIRQALDKSQALNVYVSQRTILHWLDDFHQYPSSVIQWRYVDPSQKYMDLFGVEPPSILSLDLIKQLDLESLPKPKLGTTIDPISWILGHRLDHIWSNIEGSQRHFAELIATICEQHSTYPDVLIPLIRLKLDSWATYDHIYRSLNPDTLVKDAQHLINRWAFHRYDPKLISDAYREYLNRPLITMGDTQAARYIAVVNEQTDFIKSYWHRWFIEEGQNKQSLDTAIHDMSGLSLLELAAIIRVLDEHPELLNVWVLNAIKTRFSLLPGGNIHIRHLEQRIPLIHLTSNVPDVRPLETGTSNVRDVSPLEIRIIGELQLSQPSDIRLVVTNLNNFPFEGASMRFSALNLSINIDDLAPDRKTEVFREFPPVKTDKSELMVEWRFDARLFGEPYSQQGRETMPVRRLQTQDDFEDFFDDM